MIRHIAILFALLVIPASAQLPPLPSVPTNVVRHLSAPIQRPAVTGFTLTWAPYTNAYFMVEESTNLIDWTVATNVPIWVTNVFMPSTNMLKFWRVSTPYMP